MNLAFQDVTNDLYSFLIDALPHIMQRKKLPEELFRHLENRIKEILEVSYLLGYLHIQEIVEGMNLADFDYERVVQSLLIRITLPKQEFYNLENEARFAAFTVSRILGFDAIERVKEKLAEAIQEGMTITEFIEKTGKDEILRAAGFHASNPWYWETVFRTNVQAAYQAGRMRSIWRHAEHFPYLEYIAVLDERTTEICRELHGTIAPIDDPIWDKITPPNHFNCRSVVRPVTRHEVKEYNIEPTPEEKLRILPDPQEGFVGNPATDWYGVKETMREKLQRYNLLTQVEKAEKELKKQGIVVTSQTLHKQILEGNIGKQLGGETFVKHIRRFRSRTYLGRYSFLDDQTLYINSECYKDLTELLPALLTGRLLKEEEIYKLMVATRVYLHETLHSLAPSLEVQSLRCYTYLNFRPLEEALVTVGEYYLFPSFVKFLGWNFEAFRPVYVEHKYFNIYKAAAEAMEEICMLIAKRRGIPVGNVVTECILSGTFEDWLNYLTAEALAAHSKEVAEFLDVAKTKYGKAVYQHVKEVFKEVEGHMLSSWGQHPVRWKDAESFRAGLRAVKEYARMHEYIKERLREWEKRLGGMAGD